MSKLIARLSGQPCSVQQEVCHPERVPTWMLMLCPPLLDSHPATPTEKNVLLQEKQLKLRGYQEKDVYKKLKNRYFVLTPAYDPALLQATGMNSEFDLFFKTIGLENA